MNIIKMFFRSKSQTSVDVAETWEVRWESRFGNYSMDTRPEVKVFTNHDDAVEFKEALEDSVKLLNHKVNHYIRLEKSNV